mmetsp:Transcript_14011/g.29326  ORF Transcript_14011/g.29326 Transcript_14011/m.29326 type:complete len:135 (+) Transcript_14011:125-529(+)|eukprot:CAMPEP_0201124522 /NCGR_PEP_ID=MMETSP0850-20130426/14451_1 /ASSEMBLY_ACC=CAM_ASM_000622 /TAXON_ID=183588 /ORGANISM="Pseudo-nitzschia fraudulenta, Strain WWA7" /LENGTH=134 /DNA_ID=CAMNT_0047391961 /DNA_START=78 /DNA_END=482 /DNA_ORIENTATION=-
MGKGSNVQKAQQARERNQKKMGKSDEERKAASDKAKKDACAKRCVICLQTFMVNSRPPLLYQHVVAKHPDLLSDPTRCFPELAGYDPSDPKGLKAAAKAKEAAAKKKKSKKGASNMDSLDSLLDAGLKKGKKKK